MKLTCEYVILAQRIIHDSLTDMVSAIGLVEAVKTHQFPNHLSGIGVFARLRADEVPTSDTPISVKIMRVSAEDGERTIHEADIIWRAGTGFTRVGANFQLLNIVRPERLFFRVDWKFPEGEWITGPASSLDVIEVPAPAPEPAGAPEPSAAEK